MLNDFYPVITKDGTISLFNNQVDDIYHSSIGAYTEAMNKFVLPSGILEFVKKNNKVRILDICFGLGYNSKVAANEILKVNPNCKIYIDSLEIDKNVIALSALINFSNSKESNFIDYAFSNSVFKNLEIRKIIKSYICNKEYCDFISHNLVKFIQNRSKQGNKFITLAQKKLCFHNIYYRAISIRNKNTPNDPFLLGNLDVNIHSIDARVAITGLKGRYNYIFHDGFTPAKLPTLWTVEFFTHLYNLLDETGKITTYSSSAAMRGSMKAAGFFIGYASLCNSKTIGTLGVKKESLVTHLLSKKDSLLLNTRAGIPYMDNDLSCSSEEILETRKITFNNSDRISSSQFLKYYKNRTSAQ